MAPAYTGYEVIVISEPRSLRDRRKPGGDWASLSSTTNLPAANFATFSGHARVLRNTKPPKDNMDYVGTTVGEYLFHIYPFCDGDYIRAVIEAFDEK